MADKTATTTLTKEEEEKILDDIQAQVNEERQAFDVENWSEEERKEIQKLKENISFGDTNSILQFGVGAQKEISDFTSELLKKVRTKDSGEIGDILTDLSVQVNSVDTNAFLARRSNFLSGIPGIGFFFDELRKFKAKYDSIEQNIGSIVNRLEKEYEVMMRDIVILEELYKQNLNYYRSLNLLIQAGEERIIELEDELKALEKELENNPDDDLLPQKVDEMRKFINQLEIRLQDLKLTRISTLQSFPQISMIKSGNQGLASKIQSAILNTIPLWKRHITIAISLYNQQLVVEDLEKVDNTTDELLKGNSELLRQNTKDVARALNRGIISIETLEAVQGNLLSGIQEVRDIMDEGRRNREQASEKMMMLEAQLKEKLANVENNKYKLS